MNIAIIDWGSLLRNNKALNLIGDWKFDGPRLPVEFAYVSKGKGLTIAINPSSPTIPSPWGLASFDSLNSAISSIAKLLKVDIEEIGFFSKENGNGSKNISCTEKEMLRWLVEKNLENVLWFNRRTNFQESTGSEFSLDNAIDYVIALGKNEALNMEKYVISTPEQIETPLRDRLRRELGWRNLSVYTEGFWLDKNTFIMCDKASIEIVNREKYSIFEKESEPVPMLILENAVKMIVKKDNKIMGADKIPKLGIWLDDVKKLYTAQQLWLMEHEKA